ncbi:phosphomannomutase/phosphoglucomutase [Brevibacillus sp. B_LB10_24]|uniref:phosphomannomutase/phosphoglucomutase n=1 Tax=Brevibacillus sp. B_LB10_24 TaxID=3380645 RepID=UPI0038BBEA45
MTSPAQNSGRLPSHVFREYDIRGKAEAEISRDFARLLGLAFGRRIRSAGEQKAIVGRDNRTSSPQLHAALITGLIQSGCQVVDIGEVTTPMFYFSLHHLDISSGIMVTASHNPGGDNGFKLAMDKTTLYGEAICSLGEQMQQVQYENGDRAEAQSGEAKKIDIERPYQEDLQEKIKLGQRRLKVVVDCGNGTPSPFVPKALSRWGCDVIPMYCESDPSFPHHHPDPADPENLRDLVEMVKQERADVGLAFDGDGDRLGVVDDRGRILWGDQLMILFWREIMPKYPGCQALVEVKCSQALVEEIKRLGGRPVFHRTGHSHIKATMKRLNTPFTGEMSGHFFFRDEFLGYDDALYAAGRLLRILSQTDQRLSALFSGVREYPSTPETRVACTEEQKQTIIEQVRKYFQSKYEVIDVDGARVVFPHGWGLIRASNTQPSLVLRAEADSQNALVQIKNEIEEALAGICPELSIPW